jgi:hypothetical protein
LGIEDELTAFEFDAVCSYLLEVHDNEREAKRLEIQLKGIACLLGAKPSEVFRDETGDDETDDEADVW